MFLQSFVQRIFLSIRLGFLPKIWSYDQMQEFICESLLGKVLELFILHLNLSHFISFSPVTLYPSYLPSIAPAFYWQTYLFKTFFRTLQKFLFFFSLNYSFSFPSLILQMNSHWNNWLNLDNFPLFSSLANFLNSARHFLYLFVLRSFFVSSRFSFGNTRVFATPIFW